MMKTLVILSQYKAVPVPYMTCKGCAFDGPNDCPDADCGGIIWVNIKTDEEVIEE